MRVTRKVFVLAATALLTAVIAPPAFAGESYGPVRVSYDGEARGKTWGQASLSSGDIVNKVYVQDINADGNTVYGRVAFSWYGPDPTDTNCPGCVLWRRIKTVETPEIGTAAGISNWTYRADIPGRAWKVRTSTQVCVQLGFPVWDRCTDFDDARVTWNLTVA